MAWSWHGRYFFYQCLWVTKFCAKFGCSRTPRTASIHKSFIVLRCMWKEPAPFQYFQGRFNRTAIEDPFPLWLKAPTPLLQECQGLGLFLWDEMLYLQSFDNCGQDQFQKTFSWILYCSIHNCQSILVALLIHNSSKVGTTTLSLSNCYHCNYYYHYHH